MKGLRRFMSIFLRFKDLLRSFQVYIVNFKRRPTITLAPHTAWALAHFLKKLKFLTQ